MPKKCQPFRCGGLQLLSPASPSVRCRSHSYSYAYRDSYNSYRDSDSDRCYATHSPSSDFTWPTTPSFTPYELFKLDREAPYTKTRFYDLVKIYHPDRPCNDHPLCRNLSPEVRLQRYRLVVAANEILSDPNKRAAYDLHGIGWSLHPPRPMASWSRPGYNGAGPIYANATWEDWERWHNRHQGQQRHVVDHRMMTKAIILLTLFGGAVQASWITSLSTGYEDRLREVNEESARFLTGRRQNTVKSGTSEAKMQHFLIRRDPSGHGLVDEEQPVYHNVLRSEALPQSVAEAGVEATVKTGVDTAVGTEEFQKPDESVSASAGGPHE